MSEYRNSSNRRVIVTVKGDMEVGAIIIKKMKRTPDS